MNTMLERRKDETAKGEGPGAKREDDEPKWPPVTDQGSCWEEVWKLSYAINAKRENTASTIKKWIWNLWQKGRRSIEKLRITRSVCRSEGFRVIAMITMTA